MGLYTVDAHAHTINYKQTVPYIDVGVQNFCLYQYVLYDVSYVHDKFPSYAFDVKFAMAIYKNPRANLIACVHNNECHYAPHDVTYIQEKYRAYKH